MRGLGIRLSTDDPLGIPLKNQRVRWALSMAIDRQGMKDSLYSGESTDYMMFFPPTSSYYQTPADMVEVLENRVGIPHDEAVMVEKMFEFNPEEAKKILAEEGYPNGFPTKVITESSQVDYLSVVAGYFANIGVDMDIDVRENTVYRSIIDQHNTKAMLYYRPSWIGTNPAKWVYVGPGDPTKEFTVSNRWELSDPILDNYIQTVNANYGQDLVAQNAIMQEAEAWITWMAPLIFTPGVHNFRLHHPWVKNYYGFEDVGFRSHSYYTYYAWIDQALKAEMLGK